MIKKEKWIRWLFGLFIILSVLLSWCPWLDANRANAWATSYFNDAWKDTADGCGVQDATAIKKKLFGYQVKLFYDCGLKPINSRELSKSKTVFVTAIGIVF